MMRVFRRYVSRSLLVLLVLEFLHLGGSMYLGQALYSVMVSEQPWPSLHSAALSISIFTVVMGVIMTAMGLYERHFWNGKTDMLLRIAVSFLIGSFVVMTVYYLILGLYLPRSVFSLAFGLGFSGVMILRLIFFQVARNAKFKRRILVLGIGEKAAQLEELQNYKASGFSVLGYLQLHKDELSKIAPQRIRKQITTLPHLVIEWSVDEIVVAMDDQRQGFPSDELLECKLNGVQISDFLTFFEHHTSRVQLNALRPSHLIFADDLQLPPFNAVLKRLFDLIAGVLLLVLTSPIMLLAALTVWLESGGREPVLYWQERTGFNNEPFNLVKFRSMQVNAEEDGQAVWAEKNDPRITRVGKVIRNTRIDELPQLYNVLRGDMSFVGPRPERPQFVAQLTKKIPFYTMRHVVKPGITGWAQICYSYGDSVEDARRKLEYDLYYIKHYSLFFDTVILLQTVHTVFWGKSAH